MGLRDRAATTNAYSRGTVRASELAPAPHGTGSLVPVLVEPGELGRDEIASVSVLDFTSKQAPAVCVCGGGVRDQVSYLDGAVRCYVPAIQPISVAAGKSQAMG